MRRYSKAIILMAIGIMRHDNIIVYFMAFGISRPHIQTKAMCKTVSHAKYHCMRPHSDTHTTHIHKQVTHTHTHTQYIHTHIPEYMQELLQLGITSKESLFGDKFGCN